MPTETPTPTNTPQNTVIKAPRPRRALSPFQSGLPDPRPVTDYTVALSTVSGHSRLTVTLLSPCVIRQPMWPLIDCVAGTLVVPSSCTPVSNTQFYLDFAGIITPSTAFVQVPYQDTQVQNNMGGFVRPGGQWFRAPVMPG
jgi:hypothetical protein